MKYILTIHLQDRSKTVKTLLNALEDIVIDANAPPHPLFGNTIDLDVIEIVARDAYATAQAASVGRLGVNIEFVRTIKNKLPELEIYKINLPANTILPGPRITLKVRPERELIATVRKG